MAPYQKKAGSFVPKHGTVEGGLLLVKTFDIANWQKQWISQCTHATRQITDEL